MTDIEMLPLPKWCYADKHLHVGSAAIRKEMRAYARACVAHATAARDAEIERLRAEVDAVWASMPRDARYLDPPDGGCVPLHEQVRRMAADATRAERLAEALDSIARVGKASRNQTTRTRWIVARAVSALNGDNDWRQITKPKGYHGALERAALRDHDQEGKDG